VTDHHGVLRLNTALLATFGGIGLMLTLIGVYGVMAYVVGQRVREFAVRMALGATRRQILGLVMASGVWLSASGLCAGLLMTWPVMTVFARIVKTAENLDLVFTGPWFVIGVCGAISAVALFACLLPARRATTVPPMEVLRLE
jgi:ABC-type antimicrobial peptide transport system permease subunit